tara:strand:+ start:3060 stop:3482 length:423 start_codon:yes stop_codon:yes gene_type:complete
VRLIFSVLIAALISGCATLSNLAGAAAGAAAGSFAGPQGAAGGAAVGVIAAKLITDEYIDPPITVPDSPASALHETANLVKSVGWWYLILFVLVPLFTKRGRGWMTGLAKLHDSATKKEVNEQAERLNSLEETLSGIKKE